MAFSTACSSTVCLNVAQPCTSYSNLSQGGGGGGSDKGNAVPWTVWRRVRDREAHHHAVVSNI